MIGIKIEDGQSVYQIGSVLDLTLQLSEADALIVGDTTEVEIRDIFDNVIGTATAEHIGGGLYVTEWQVPISLVEKYNNPVGEVLTINGEEVTMQGEPVILATTEPADDSEMDQSVYILKDVWVFPDSTEVEFVFYVDKAPEQALSKDAIYIIDINNLNDTGMSTSVSFTSEISDYAITVEDVTAVSNIALDDIDPYLILKQISLVSDYVDNHMKPNTIVNINAYESAVRCFVRHMAAGSLLKDYLGLESESKKLDTFQIERSYNYKGLLDDIQNSADKCALVIFAGGNDTPFTTKTFQKGLYDPNRPRYARANLDITGDSPWVNITSTNFIGLDARGNEIEIRGVRTIALSSDQTLA